MTKTHFVILMAAFTITQAGTAWVMQNAIPSRWEYRTAYIAPGEEGYFYGKDLKTLGKEKWELISVVPDGGGRQICFFKRPVVH
jgi:hypothetical protein